MKIEQKIIIKDLTKEELTALETTFKFLQEVEDNYENRHTINYLYNTFTEGLSSSSPLAVAVDLLSAILAHCVPIKD